MQTSEVLWTAITVCSIAYVSWRIWLWKTRFRRSGALLPPSNQLSWEVPGDQTAPSQLSQDRRKRRSPPRARSEVPSGDVARLRAAATLASVDPKVLAAVQITTAEQLRGVGSISDYVQANFRDVSATSAQAWMQHLEDYVAEQQAAIALEKAGHSVQLDGGQTGWRWLVDGHPIEVSEGIASVKGALTGLRNAPRKKGEMVEGLSDFDHDAITTASKDALSVIHEGLDPGLHIPLGTLLRSAWRELELLFDKKTPIERAVKHVVMDVASVGTGAYIGAKVGGGLGAVAGPVGVGAGLLVGGIAGAIAGRGLAHRSRMAPFSKAYERYEIALSSARSGVEAALAESKAEVRELESLYQRKFETARSEMESAARQQLEEIEKRQTESLMQFLRQFPEYLSALETQLLHEEAAVLNQIGSSPWWNWIFPRRRDLEKSLVRQWFKRARKVVRKERHRFEKLKDRPAVVLHSRVHRFLNMYGFSLQPFDERLVALASEFTEARIAAETINQAALCEMEKLRNQMLVDFRDRVSKMYFALCQTIAGWKKTVENNLDELRRQAGPLGIELPD
jgi:hypothetical protein